MAHSSRLRRLHTHLASAAHPATAPTATGTPTSQTSQAIGDFAVDGYSILPQPIFPESVIDRANAGLAAELAKLPPTRSGGRSTVSQGPAVTLASDGVPELLGHPALLEWARRVTGFAEPRVWWVQYFGKEPDEVEGGYTGWCEPPRPLHLPHLTHGLLSRGYHLSTPSRPFIR